MLLILLCKIESEPWCKVAGPGLVSISPDCNISNIKIKMKTLFHVIRGQHPIDSLYTVELVKDTVPVIEHIFGAKYVR